PSMSGMRTSMRTMSGSSRRATSIASRPVLAWPTTSMSPEPWSIAPIPWRTSSWSSTRRTRVAIPPDSRAAPRASSLVDREPYEIRDECEHDEREHHDDRDAQRSDACTIRFSRAALQRSDRTAQLGSGRVLAQPAARVIELSRKLPTIALVPAQHVRRHAERRFGITGEQRAIHECDIGVPLAGLRCIRDARDALDLVVAFEL